MAEKNERFKQTKWQGARRLTASVRSGEKGPQAMGQTQYGGLTLAADRAESSVRSSNVHQDYLAELTS